MNFFKEFFRENILQKAFALGMALVIWAMAPTPQKEGFTEMQFFVAISYINLPKNMEFIESPPQSVSLFVSIPNSEVGELNPAQFQVQVDLSNAEPGDNNITIRRNEILAPKTAVINKINPETLDLVLEEGIEKLVDIKPVFQGQLGEGYVVEKVELNPAQVLVRGPKSQLEAMVQIETKAINIEGLTGQVDMLIKPIFPQGITLVEPKPDLFAARIRIGSQPVVMNFENLPIGVVNQVYVTRFNPKSFNITVRGPKRLVEALKKDDIQAFINLQPYEPGKYKIKSPTIRLSPEIQIIRVWPPIDLWVLKQKIYE